MTTNRWIGVVCHWGDESDCGKGSRPLHTLQVVIEKSFKSQSIMVIHEGDGDYNVDLLQDTFGVGARRSTSKGGTGGG